ncbi:hypothetical protein Leryth_008064 [Lithospermum erythrorhizon]|nr:hypothetical protein Leryth_008064 [Lithospermum erythrorhizon]
MEDLKESGLNAASSSARLRSCHSCPSCSSPPCACYHPYSSPLWSIPPCVHSPAEGIQHWGHELRLREPFSPGSRTIIKLLRNNSAGENESLLHLEQSQTFNSFRQEAQLRLRITPRGTQFSDFSHPNPYKPSCGFHFTCKPSFSTFKLP